MNKRLQQFLAAENITQSQLADTLGVARASVSHIVAGRNKPSFDFIEGMAHRFPSLNLEWLITGKGRMYDDGMDLFAQASSKAVERPFETVFDASGEQDLFSAAQTSAQQQIKDDAAAQTQYQSSATSQPQFQAAQANTTLQRTEQAQQRIQALNALKQPENALKHQYSSRSIQKIVVFYDDNTFQELK